MEVLSQHPALILLLAFGLDYFLGDPVYPWHPVRLIGSLLSSIENYFFAKAEQGGPSAKWRTRRPGGLVLFLLLSLTSLGVYYFVNLILNSFSPWLSFLWTCFIAYSLLALGDLLHHGQRILKAGLNKSIDDARIAAGYLVGRDLNRMNLDDCMRAGVESLSENLCDGVVAPLFWYALAGMPGLIVFKVVSTMDSMVGYKTPRYLHFGWCGARLDDVMNWIPARITAVLLCLVAFCIPDCNGKRAWKTALAEHKKLPGFNSGWPEMACAGALDLLLIGPLYKNGELVCDIWVGSSTGSKSCPPQKLGLCISLIRTVGIIFTLMAIFRYLA